MLNFRLFLSSFISLSLAACSGSVERDNGKGDTLTSSDTDAMLHAAETMYHGFITCNYNN